MATLIEERPADKFQSPQQCWLIGKDFELLIFLGNPIETFFIRDRKGILNPLELIPKIFKELKLDQDPDFEIAPSIDTCGFYVTKKKREELFKLLENYLLSIGKERYKMA